MPLPFEGLRGIIAATARGMLFFLLLGILCRIWMRKFPFLCIGVATGIAAAGSWHDARYSGHPTFGIYALIFGWIDHFIYGYELVIPLFISAAVAWFVTDLLVRRYFRITLSRNCKAALLFAGAVLTGLLVNAIGPLSQFLSFAPYRFEYLWHQKSFLFILCLATSLVLGAWAGIHYRGPVPAKSLFWAVAIAVIVLPMQYSFHLEDQIHRTGMAVIEAEMASLMVSLPAEMEPLIAAVEAFRDDHNEAPGSLDALVPKYVFHLPEIKNDNLSDLYYYRDWQDPKNFSFSFFIHAPFHKPYEKFTYTSDGEYPDYYECEPFGKWLHCYHE